MDSIVGDAIDEAEEAETPSPEGTSDDAGTSPTGAMTDDELQEVLKDLQTDITVVG